MKRTLFLFTAAFVAASMGLSVGAIAQAQLRHTDRPIPIDVALLRLNINFKLTPISKFIVTLAHDIECEAGLIQCNVPMAKPVPTATVPPVIVVIPPVKVSVPPVVVNVSVPPVVISVTPVVVPPVAPVVVPPVPVVLPVVPPVSIPAGSTSTCTVTATNGGVTECNQSSTVSAQS
jgi:hypothetical protein